MPAWWGSRWVQLAAVAFLVCSLVLLVHRVRAGDVALSIASVGFVMAAIGVLLWSQGTRLQGPASGD